jgi:hypothetical protein
VRTIPLIIVGGSIALAFVLGWWCAPNPPPNPRTVSSGDVRPQRDVVAESVRAGRSDAFTAGPFTEPPAAGPDSTDALAPQHALERQGYDLLASDPGKAFAELAGIESKTQRAAFLSGMFQRAAGMDSAQAIDLALRLDSKRDRDLALSTLLREWSGSGDFRVVDYASALAADGAAGVLGRFLLGRGEARGEANQHLAVKLADGFLTGEQRANLLGAAAAQLARTDPQRAFDLGSDLLGENQTRFLRQLAEGWAQTDPAAAWKWTTEFTDPAVGAELQNSILFNQAQTDPSGAAARWATLPPDHPARHQTLQAIAEAWAASDTAAARTWIAQMPPADAAVAIKGFESSAPVGIGAVLTGSAQGYPQIQELVPGSSASRLGSLKPGEQIVAVADGSGSWLNARSLGFEETVKLIRGAPGTSAMLRVLPPGATDPTQARVVVIPRGQIIR